MTRHREPSRLERAGHWLRRRWARSSEWARSHQLATMLIVVTLVVAPGYWRQEHAIHQAQQASADARKASADTKRIARQQAAESAARIADERAIIATVRDQLRCTKRTLAIYTEQNRTLRPKANQRINGLYRTLDAAFAGDPQRARRIYARASRRNQAYLRYVHNHPVPSLAKVCSHPSRLPPPPKQPQPKPAAPSPSVITTTAPAPPPIRITVCCAGTTTMPAPPPRTITSYAPPGQRHRKANR